MAFINRTVLDEVDQRLMDTYKEFAVQPASNVGSIVNTQSTGGRKSFVHAFIGGFPNERIWEGERLVKSLKNQEITGTTTKYELTLGVDVEDAMSDVLAPSVAQFSELGKMTSRFLDRRVADFLSTGNVLSTDNTNYDALALFSASHVTDSSAANSNLNTSHALSHANLITSWEQMRGMTDQNDNPLSLTPKYIVVPAALELTARELVQKDMLTANDGDSNILRGLLEVIVLPELDSSSTTRWFLIAGGLPAFTNHELSSPDLVSKTDLSDDNVFWDDELVYGWTARSKLLAGPYQLIQSNIA